MKYFNPSFLFKLWILIIPIFHNEKQKVQSMPIKSLTNPINLTRIINQFTTTTN
ncbi:MAG: hypothetical protein PPFGHCPK_00501 [Spiroplasma endosymbiont of Drosophila atripex]|nr:MAG: hypothetical protein PPFGHCPK_00501 [Spiroplasma endosymbiont of Drosophila atripex]